MFLDMLYEQVLIEHTDDAVDAVDRTTYTFASKSLGAAHSNRQIAVGIVSTDASAGETISSATFNGVSASEWVVSDNNTSSVTRLAALWVASVPTGTTGDIVITFSTEVSRCAIVVYRVINAKTTAHDTATDESSPYSQSLDVPGFGAAIAIAHIDDGDATTTWTGLTEDVDSNVEGSGQTGIAYSSASQAFNTAQSVTVTMTPSNVINDNFAAASFAPL